MAPTTSSALPLHRAFRSISFPPSFSKTSPCLQRAPKDEQTKQISKGVLKGALTTHPRSSTACGRRLGRKHTEPKVIAELYGD
eukprot:8063295-Pyramimonas_sp.AAC.1